jgi:hypothetical protein
MGVPKKVVLSGPAWDKLNAFDISTLSGKLGQTLELSGKGRKSV